MKYKLNEKVVIKKHGQVVGATIVNVKKFPFMNLYTCMYTLSLHERGVELYKQQRYTNKFEWQILGLANIKD